MKKYSVYYLLLLQILLFERGLYAQCDCNPNSCSITATISYQGTAAQGDYSTFIAPSNNGTLTNPIIIVEGLDLNNTFGCTEFMEYGYELVEQLNSLGYDVVFLNFANNTDFIERNAFLIVELINQINASKSGNSKLIVTGINTGAVVARYALAYMEANQLDHQTKCYISIDGPQNGLNIPVGLQIWLNAIESDPFLFYSGLQGVAPVLGNTMLNQLMYCSGPFTENQSNGGPPIPSTAYTDFFTELRGLNSCYGYPEKCKKIAVSLGATDQSAQTNLDGSTAVSGNLFFTYNYNPSNDNLPVDPGVLGATSGWVSSVIDENVATDFPGGTFPATCAHFDILESFSWEPTNCTASQLRPYDICPGSFNSDLLELAITNAQEFLNYSYVSAVNVDATFVPTTSAFDINTTDFFFDFSAHLPIESVSPFDKCYSEGFNDYYGNFYFFDNLPSDFWTEIGNSNGYLDCSQEDAVVPPSTISSGSSDAWQVSQNLTVNNYVIESGGRSLLQAGQSIFVENGFVAGAGSAADLTIVPCNYKVCTPPSFLRPPHNDAPLHSITQPKNNIFSMNIYPNPTANILQVSLSNQIEQNGVVRITDLSGMVLHESAATQNLLNLDVSNFADGIYFLTYLSKDQNVTQKFSIAR